MDDAQNAPYLERLDEYLSEIADAGTSVDVRGMKPADRRFGRLTESGCAAVAMKTRSMRRERATTDLFPGTLRPGLYEARSPLTIPFVGIGET